MAGSAHQQAPRPIARRFILAALGFQLCAAYASLQHPQFSVFCTAGKSWAAWLVAAGHFTMIPLFLTGLASLAVPALRKPYLGVLLVGLCCIAPQKYFMKIDLVFCDEL